MSGEPLHVLGVIGSPRTDSVSARFVEEVLAEAASRGAATRTFDLRDTPLPPLDLEADLAGEPFARVCADARWADAFVLGTPDYHGGPSGILKNYLDHLWRELAGKLFAIVVASNEKGLTAQDQLRTLLRQCYAWSLPYGTGAPQSALAEDGTIVDRCIGDRLRMMGRDLVVYGTLLRDQGLADRAAPRDPLAAGFLARVRPG